MPHTFIFDKNEDFADKIGKAEYFLKEFGKFALNSKVA